MKSDNRIILLVGLLLLCCFIVVIYSGARDGLIGKDAISLALIVVFGSIVVSCASVLVWSGWECYIRLRKGKEKAEGE